MPLGVGDPGGGWIGPPIAEGTGATPTACPTGAWLQIIGANPSRKFATITVPADEADSLLISLPVRQDLVESGAILELSPGQTLILSVSGDMPWLGPVYGQGYGADSSFFYGEVAQREP